MANTGNKNPGNFANDPKKASEAGRSGGQRQGKENNPGNFANDPDKASEAGRAGGQHQGKENNPGNFANDPDKASEAGRKGVLSLGGTGWAASAGVAHSAKPAHAARRALEIVPVMSCLWPVPLPASSAKMRRTPSLPIRSRW